MEDPVEHMTAEGTPALHGGKLLRLGRAQEQQWLKHSVACVSLWEGLLSNIFHYLN